MKQQCRYTSEEVSQLASKLSVSERTARRYIKQGLPPDSPFPRIRGKNGKSYPPVYRRKDRMITPLDCDLAHARRAIKRIERKAEAEGFYPEDLAALQEISRLIEQVLFSWEAAVD